jgi:uncharacterized iron-regulated membrane protein
MRLLSLIHRWAGGLIGLLLTVLGLTGALLVWDSALVRVPGASDPLVHDVGRLAQISERAAAGGELKRITFASDELRLHEAAFEGGGGAYIRQDGSIVERWQTMWERPELWLFDLHHFLFAGKNGEIVVGIAGLAGVLFTITGIILWWRTRRKFRLNILPRNWRPGAIVHHHRDLGIVAAPLLLLSSATGAFMVFPFIQNAFFGKGLVHQPVAAPAAARADTRPIAAALEQASARFPEAEIRRVSMPSGPGKPIGVRLRQPFEWTPNGRTQMNFDGRTGALVSVQDPSTGGLGTTLQEKIYPLHAAKVGGVWLKLAMTFSGLAVAMLGAFATYSFWIRKVTKRKRVAQATRRATVHQPAAAARSESIEKRPDPLPLA